MNKIKCGLQTVNPWLNFFDRYKPWNNVENIINREKEGNIIVDVGCGNGKNLKASSKYCFIGLDFSLYLLKTAKKKPNTDMFLANCINIPMKSSKLYF